MNFPVLPTDNLYKFLAIAGLVILLFCAVYPIRLVGELQLKSAELDTKVQLLTNEANAYNQEVSTKGGLSKPDYDKAQIRMQTFAAKKIELVGEIRKARILSNQLIFLLVFTSVGSIAGIWLSYFGFRLWYLRVQRPADLLAAKQLA